MSYTYKKSYWPYIDLFKKYKNDCSIFFETGTHCGESVSDAIELGFEKIISVEIDKSLYEYCIEKFKDYSDRNKLHLFLGSSEEHLDTMLLLVDKKTLFWIDAHHGNGEPAFIEIEKIKSHSIKTHTIIVDDIPLYFGDGTTIKERILQINSNYKFTFENVIGYPNSNYHLVAYI